MSEEGESGTTEANLQTSSKPASAAFAAFRPKPKFVWNEEVLQVFEFYRQESNRKLAVQYGEGLAQPSELAFPVPELDHVASKSLKEDAKGGVASTSNYS
jgi:hypothetical protein